MAVTTGPKTRAPPPTSCWERRWYASHLTQDTVQGVNTLPLVFRRNED